MKSLKYLLVISLVALPIVASACGHPWTIYNNTSIFRLDNSNGENRNIRETNCRGWQQLTDCNIPLKDIEEVFAAGGVDRIMFDNFSVEQTREAVALVAGRCETESSGGITLETLRDYAETGVDFISIGALTHQIKSLDMSLKAC